ncbi:MAG: alpha/beta hydrolase, partial [Rhizobiaceae bacterium]|nr:alpha/beta hydrolase [Rhizobiaceae bacterium]
NLIAAAIAFLAAALCILFGVTRTGTWLIERRNPPVGAFIEAGGGLIHYVYLPPPSPDAPVLVFLHGASGNLNDQMLPLRPRFEGAFGMLFFDRPGHGWSERGEGNDSLDGQAATLAKLMDRLAIGRAILVGHSFGGALAAAFALDYPARTAGLVFLSAATHPWPGGATSWYYSVAALPGVGWLFSQTLTLPAGWARMAASAACVFAPNPLPADYLRSAEIALVLRPSAFRANAIDVEGLYRFAKAAAPRYREIGAPTVVISGDSDTVVYEEIHSAGLARDIPGAEMVWIHNLGHKPDWIAPELVAAAVRKVAGDTVDLASVARAVEARIAADAHGADCVDEKPALAVQ